MKESEEWGGFWRMVIGFIFLSLGIVFVLYLQGKVDIPFIHEVIRPIN